MIENQETKTNQKANDEVLPTAACSPDELENSLDEVKSYTLEMHDRAWLTGMSEKQAAKNVVFTFMTPWQLLLFSFECLIGAIRKRLSL